MKKNTILYCAFILIALACGRKEDTAFDKGPMLKNIAYNLAIPAYEQSLASFESLQHELNNLANKSNATSIEKVKSHWKTAAISWAKTAPYRFGPVDELLIENSFHYFPADTAKLIKALADFSGEKDFIQKLGSDTQGLAAIEYLLFREGAEDQNYNLAFNQMLVARLVELNLQVLNQWKDQYAKDFAKSTGSELSSSLTKLSNQWIELVDYIKGDEIGRPAGKTVGIEKNIYNLQAPYSKISSTLIDAKLSALQESFNGGEKEGIDDYLRSLDIKMSDNLPLDEKINQQINGIRVTLEEGKALSYLILEESKIVDQLYLESLNLSIMLKTDMMSQLGLITTFSDTDGD